MQSMMVLYLQQHSYPAQVGTHFGLLENCLKCLPEQGKPEASLQPPCRHPGIMLVPQSLLPLSDSIPPTPGSLHYFNENGILKIAALRLELPGAPTPTEFTSKLSPCRDKLSPTEMMPGLQCAQGHLLKVSDRVPKKKKKPRS